MLNNPFKRPQARRPSNTSRKSRARQRGQSLVELAFALPLFLVLVMGIIDFSWGLKSWISITNAAREAARYGAVSCAAGDDDASGVSQRAIDTASGLGLTAANVTVTNCSPGASTESVIVDIQYDYQLITPLGGLLSILGGGSTGIGDSIPLKSSADMRME